MQTAHRHLLCLLLFGCFACPSTSPPTSADARDADTSVSDVVETGAGDSLDTGEGDWVDSREMDVDAEGEDLPDIPVADAADSEDSDIGEADAGEDDAGEDDADETDLDTGPMCENPCPVESSVSSARTLDSAVFTRDVARTTDNPLRGFMTSYLWSEPHNDFPHQLEYFYLPMADLWGPDGETLDEGLEPHLAAAAARGHHAVFRVFVDYPARESGLPPHLADAVSCQVYTEFGGGCSPDYDDPALVEAMLWLIEALGARYDGDPRLGFVQVGLLGFWGEWHTWPHEDWFPSAETQTAVLNAFDAAFERTQMQVRLPYANALSLRIGFHDDSFAHSTIGPIDWFFVPILEATGGAARWQEVAIGGELRPELQGLVFDDDYEIGEYRQDFAACVDATHVTYLLNYSAFSEAGTGYVGAERERAEAAALTLGYEFELNRAEIRAHGLLGDTVEAQVTVALTQTGVAPFYYPLALELASDVLDAPVGSEGDLSALLPGESQEVVFELGRVPVDVLNTSTTVSFRSDMLLEGQRIEFATVTPWDGEADGTTLDWGLGCEGDGGELFPVGAAAGVTSEGCTCVCDVDGEIRACGGELCE